MTDYNQIAGSEIDVDSPLTASIFEKLRDNPIAITEAINGAPQIASATSANQQTALEENSVTAAKIASGAVNDQKIANSAIHQAELDTSISSNSFVTTSSGNQTVHLLLASGQFGFYPQIKTNNAGTGWFVDVSFDDLIYGGPPITTSFRTQMSVRNVIQSGTRSIYVQSRYINSSPPYNIGNGDIANFIYAEIDNSTSEIVSTYAADAPPWAYNGPTDIRPDFYDKQGRPWRFKRTIAKQGELTGDFEQDQSKIQDSITKRRLMKQARQGVADWSQLADHIEPVTHEIKNADMPLIPQPMTAEENTTVVLINPTCALVDDLALLQKQGQDISELLHNGYLTIDNESVDVAAPPGVKIVNASWKKTSR